MIRALIFDMDGLMIDTEKLYWQVGRAIAAEHGRAVSDDTLRKMTGRDRLASSRIMAEESGLPMSAEQVMQRREVMMLERFQAGGIETMPGLREILRRFYRRLRLGVSTSSPHILAKTALSSLGLDSNLDAITAGDEVLHGKPDPALYLRTMSKMGVRPEESVVLEDAPSGALAGKRAGAYVIAIPSELTLHEDFSRIADVRVKDLFEAAEHVERLIQSARRT